MKSAAKISDWLFLGCLILLGTSMILWACQNESYQKQSLSLEHYYDLWQRSLMSDQEYTEAIDLALKNQEYLTAIFYLSHLPETHPLKNQSKQLIQNVNDQHQNWLQGIADGNISPTQGTIP